MPQITHPLGIVIRQSIRSSVFAYLGVIIGYVNVLWLFPYFMDTEQVGLMRLLQTTIVLLATFGQLGMPQTAVRFFPERKKDRGFPAFLQLMGLLGFLVLALLAYLFRDAIIGLFSDKSPLFVEYFEFTILLSFCFIQFQIMEALSKSHLKTIFPAFVKEVQQRFLITILVFLFGFGLLSFEQMIYSLFIVYASLLVSMSIYLVRLGALSGKVDFSFLNKTRFRQIMRYGFYSLLGAGGTQIVLQIDSVMVSSQLGTAANGIYSIAFFMGLVIEMPKRSITQVVSPLIAQANERQDVDQIRTLYKQSSINQFIIGSLLLLGIWANLDNVYQFIPNGKDYETGMGVVLFIGLGKLSDMLFGVNGEIIVMSKHYRFNVIAVSILALLTIGLNYLLIPEYGLEGAAMASMVAMLTFNLSKYVFVWLKLGMQPFTAKTGLFVLIMALAVFVNSLLPAQAHPLVDLLLRSAIITVVVLAPTYALALSPEMNGIFHRFIQVLMGKKA